LFAKLDDESHADFSKNSEARAVAGLGGVMGVGHFLPLFMHKYADGACQ
jgi:hypothetical protein